MNQKKKWLKQFMTYQKNKIETNNNFKKVCKILKMINLINQ